MGMFWVAMALVGAIGDSVAAFRAKTERRASFTQAVVDGLETWSTVAGLTAHSQTVLNGNGNATVTVTAPDGTKEVSVTTAG